jgi:3-hydroxyacyl-[acyl-carrier-protein] dehydratase
MDDQTLSTEAISVDIHRIMEMIPHRYPFLLIDKVEDIMTGESARGIKNVTINEPFFPGHFPGSPVMPGVLIIEAMAQTSAVLVVHTLGKDSEGKLVYFMSIDDARFRKPVMPGDRIELVVRKIHSRRNVWKFDCEALVDGKRCAEAKISAMIMDS